MFLDVKVPSERQQFRFWTLLRKEEGTMHLF